MIEFLSDKLFITPLIALATAQILKSVVFWIHDRAISTKYLFTDGGMPSGHSALTASLTTAMFFDPRVSLPLFIISFFMMMITVRDSVGVRYESAKQAIVLNKLIHRFDIHTTKALKELIGHTKTQSFAGITAGLIVGALSYIYF
jgi:acid phosphatase family membrane protein YuiD